jgi:FixJ family two-component response regulator
MSESASDLYERAVEKGREVARASRYEGLNNDKLGELLPELSAEERQVLGERIEDVVENEVKNTLTQREREVNK